MHKGGADTFARCRQAGRQRSIQQLCKIPLGLGIIDASVGGRIHHAVRRAVLDERLYPVDARAVELRARRRNDVGEMGEGALQRAADLAGAAEEQDAQAFAHVAEYSGRWLAGMSRRSGASRSLSARIGGSDHEIASSSSDHRTERSDDGW